MVTSSDKSDKTIQKIDYNYYISKNLNTILSSRDSELNDNINDRVLKLKEWGKTKCILAQQSFNLTTTQSKENFYVFYRYKIFLPINSTWYTM